MCYPGKDTGGSGPGQTGNQGDWLWPVSHCQGCHLDKKTHKETKNMQERVYTKVCIHVGAVSM